MHDLKQSILEETLELMRLKRYKYDTTRINPVLQRNEKQVERYLAKHLFERDNKIWFKGEYRYEPQDWPTETVDQRHKIAKFISERCTLN